VTTTPALSEVGPHAFDCASESAIFGGALLSAPSELVERLNPVREGFDCSAKPAAGGPQCTSSARCQVLLKRRLKAVSAAVATEFPLEAVLVAQVVNVAREFDRSHGAQPFPVTAQLMSSSRVLAVVWLIWM
jgi:hypothetical protein